MKHLYIFIACLLISNSWLAQDSNVISQAFFASKIAHTASTHQAEAKTFYMYVSHRFGSVKGGINTFFGLDNAITNIRLTYGLTDRVQISASRESLRRTYAVSSKIKLKEQSNSWPFNASLFLTSNINTQVSTGQYPYLILADRLSYASQLLLSRSISPRIALQIAPSFVRQNLVLEASQAHDQYAIALGGLYRLNKLLSLTIDYAYHLNRNKQSIYQDPLSIGLDLNTGGHVFQFVFSNSQSANAPSFLSNAEGDWMSGDVFFGFNIVRKF